jgi:hypothetical protein
MFPILPEAPMYRAQLTWLAALVLLSFGTAGELEAQRRCTKGIPCGNTCIAANRTCRVGTTPRQPTPAPASRAAATAPPAAPLAAAAAPLIAPASEGLAVPGVPGYVALDSIELREVQEARQRALDRLGVTSPRAESAPELTMEQARAMDAQARAARAAAASSPIRSADGPWVASSRGTTYYRNGCNGARGLAVQNRIYFQSEEEARAAGYRRSTARGC